MQDLFTEIWESVRRNKLRTALTGFSVAWGIFMIIVLLGAGNGLMNSFNQDSEGFASNIMEVFGSQTTKPYAGFKEGRRIELKKADMELIAKRFPDIVDQISTSISRSGFTMTYGKKYYNSVTLAGTFPGQAAMERIRLYAGRFINANDIKEKRKVIVLTHLSARNILEGGTDYESLIGKRVKVGNLSFKIIGVRHSHENQNDRDLYIPFTTSQTIFGMDDSLDRISFTFNGLDSEEANEEFEQRLKSALAGPHQVAPDDEGAFWIWNRFTQNLQMQKGSKALQTGLWIVGIFTLLGGIVGVSNIMLITVKERTHEFGIRKALGAKPWNIMLLIIAESIVITAFFGYIGMLLGLGACELMDNTLGQATMDLMGQSIRLLVNPKVGIDVAVKATVLLIVAGTLAGLMPARRAAKVRPIEALRAD
ncbi:MAG TPA: ABC transporter permease [Bacteroidaceae bacterium]|nr:ABC transporter permease [Bacteroidaceae bacterium]HQL26283.1 ABC transporter permease [Bacteroidaceae bacterium]